MQKPTEKKKKKKIQKIAEKKEYRLEMRQLRKAWRIAPDTIKMAFLSWIQRDAKSLPTDALSYAYVAIGQLERITDDDPKKDEALDMVQDWIEKHR